MDGLIDAVVTFCVLFVGMVLAVNIVALPFMAALIFAYGFNPEITAIVQGVIGSMSAFLALSAAIDGWEP